MTDMSAENAPKQGISRRTLLLKAGAVGLAAAAATGGAYKLLNPDSQSVAVKVSATPTPTEAQTPTDQPTVKETPKPPPTEAPKDLPDVISKDTVKFLTLQPSEVKSLQGTQDSKFALPEILNKDGVSMIQIHDRRGQTMFALVGAGEGTYTLPAIYDGNVSKNVLSKTANFSGFIVSRENGIYVYFLPSPSSSQFKEGDGIKMGQDIVTFSYQPQSQNGQEFKRYLQTTYVDAPENVFAIIAIGENPTKGINLNKDNILTTTKGEVVLLSPQK